MLLATGYKIQDGIHPPTSGFGLLVLEHVKGRVLQMACLRILAAARDPLKPRKW